MNLYFIDNERGQSIPAWMHPNGKLYASVRNWHGQYWVETDSNPREPFTLYEIQMLARVADESVY